jgi:hypothetical protein
MTLKNWQLCYVDRSAFGTSAGMAMSAAMPITSGPTAALSIPAATIANGVVTPGITVVASAPNAPGTTPTIAGVTGAYVCPTLIQAIGKELFLLRPRVYDGANNTPGTVTTGDDYTEGTTADLVPIDSLDLTGADQIAANVKTTDLPVRLQYRRGSQPPITSGSGASAVTSPSYAWNFVYPGPYNYAAVSGTGQPASTEQLRPAGIVVESASGTAGPPLTAGNLGQPDGGASDPTAQNNSATTYATAPLELSNTFGAGPNPLNYKSGTSNVYPFGQFARNLDMLQIPFIGSYRIRSSAQITANHFTEMNTVTMDSFLGMNTRVPTLVPGAVATKATSDTTPYSGFYEQIGRFCPVGDPAAQTGDFSPQPSLWTYHWGEKLLSYFTVQAPHDDYYPNVDPTGTTSAVPLTPSGLVYPAYAAPTGANTVGTGAPIAIANNDSTSAANAINAGSSEDTAGVEGLININTAPAPVLAQIPFYAGVVSKGALYPTDPTINPNQQTLNAQLAVAIVAYRNQYGPFKSIFDLYRVPAFQQLVMATDLTGVPLALGPLNGVYIPGGLPVAPTPTMPYVTDSLRYDFKQRFALLNNISNLITTRSDTFTCYILLQGWRNVGTSTPTLAVQRRAAFIIDRNAVTPSNLTPLTFKVPTDQ